MMTPVADEKKKEDVLISYLDTGDKFPSSQPLYFKGEKRETKVYKFRELPRLIPAIKVIFKSCIRHDNEVLKELSKTKHWNNESFLLAYWVRIGKKLAENLSFEILNPILTETLIEMLKERNIKLRE